MKAKKFWRNAGLFLPASAVLAFGVWTTNKINSPKIPRALPVEGETAAATPSAADFPREDPPKTNSMKPLPQTLLPVGRYQVMAWRLNPQGKKDEKLIMRSLDLKKKQVLFVYASDPFRPGGDQVGEVFTKYREHRDAFITTDFTGRVLP